MKKMFGFSLALLLLSSQFGLAQEHLRVIPSSSKVEFSLRHFTGRAEGHFNRYSGTLDFDENAPEKSKISFEVDVPSVDTANGTRDDHLRGAEYFDATKHPKMTFNSESFKKTGKKRYMVTGPLTIKGHTENVTIPVVLERKTTLWATGEDSLIFEVTFNIDRTQFGVGESSSLLGSDVKIDLELEFRNAK